LFLSLSDSLISKESSLSFCLTCFLLIIAIAKQRVSKEIPYVALERQMEIKSAKYTTQKSTIFYDGNSHQIKKHGKKAPTEQIFKNQIFSLSFFP
jgi:hypothetical protein